MSQQTSLVFIVDSVQSYCPEYMHHTADGKVVISAARKPTRTPIPRAGLIPLWQVYLGRSRPS